MYVVTVITRLSPYANDRSTPTPDCRLPMDGGVEYETRDGIWRYVDVYMMLTVMITDVCLYEVVATISRDRDKIKNKKKGKSEKNRGRWSTFDRTG